MTMHAIVCVKLIQDPEIPPAKFKLDSGAMRVIPPEGIPPVINPYDEQAVELAIGLKEKYKGKVTVVSMGGESAVSIVRHAVAMGADEGIVLSDPAFEGGGSFSTAYILSRAMQKIGDYDIILCGRQAADWDEGLVGAGIARDLDLPLVTLAQSVSWAEGELTVKRITLEGYQVFAVPAPAVVTVSNEAGKPRLPKGWGIISAARKDIPIWNTSDIDADSTKIGAGAARRKLAGLYQPDQTRQCEIAAGETVEEASAELAEKMIKAGVIQNIAER